MKGLFEKKRDDMRAIIKKQSGLLAVVLAAILMLSLVACGNESTGPGYTVGGASGSVATGESGESISAGSLSGTSGTGNSTNAGMSQNTTIGEITIKSAVDDGMIYIAEPFGVGAADITSYYCMKVNGDALCYGNQHAVIYYPLSGDAMYFETMKWEEQTGEWALNQLAFDGAGNVYSIVTVKERPKSKSFICKFDSEGQLVYSYAMSEDLEELGVSAWSSGWDIEADEEGHVYFRGEDFVWIFDTDGTFAGTLTLGGSPSYDVTGLEKDEDGKVYAIYSVTGSISASYIGEIDFSSRSTVNVNKGDAMRGLSTGLDGGLLTYDRSAVYSYDKTACTMTPVFKWQECNINGNNLYYAETVADGKIVAVTFNNGINGEVYLIQKMTRAEAESQGLLPDKATITIAIWGEGNKQELQEAIVKFNKENERYKVVTEDYLIGAADADAAINRLSSEIMAGKGPDLIDEEFGILSELAEKGGIENLYDYLEKSTELSKEDFFENILEEYTVEGVLTAIPYDIMIRTLVGSSNLVGEEMGWTLEEMLALAEAYPDKEFIDGAGIMTKRFAIMDILRFYGSEFLDWENGTCNFATDKFKRILEFAADFPDQYTPSAANAPSIYSKLETGETLLAEVSLWGFRDLQAYEEALGGNMTCIGYPSPEGVGCTVQTMCAYGISSQSPNKEGAWEFLELFLQYNNVERPTMMSGFPSNKIVMEELLKKDMAYDNSPIMHAGDGWKFKYHTTTQEEADRIYALIEAMAFTSTNLEIVNIICEEADSYFSGQKPMDVVVEIIQNRVQNYMEENL